MHSVPQMFPIDVLRADLERELDRLLCEQVFERERATKIMDMAADPGDSASDSSDEGACCLCVWCVCVVCACCLCVLFVRVVCVCCLCVLFVCVVCVCCLCVLFVCAVCVTVGTVLNDFTN